jgi:hypothetical protein
MILEKKQNMPKQKNNITKDNLIILKHKPIDEEIELFDTEDSDIPIKVKKTKKVKSESKSLHC